MNTLKKTLYILCNKKYFALHDSMVDLSVHRKRELNLDLCLAPPTNHEDTATNLHRGGTSAVPVVSIDVDAVSCDDVIFSSAADFAEACRNKRRRRTYTGVGSFVGLIMREDNRHIPSRLRPIASPPPQKLPQMGIIITSPPPSSPASLSCPICMGSFKEETSTRCGHIFCRGCIMTALSVKSACPTCRKKVTKRGLIRVFLPSPGSP